MLLQVMRRVNTLELLFILSIVLCSACSPAQFGNTQQAHTEIQQRVNAAHYSSFWIWGNISSSPYLQQATELYILQGEMNWNKPLKQSEFIPQGIQVLHKPQQKIWIVIRSHHLQWSNNNIQQILQRLKHWEKNGNQIQGLQIDFDAKTQNIHRYAVFLEKIRKKMPQKYRLSITGLMDWTNVQDQQTLKLLAQNIDEIAIQTYQGSHTIKNYTLYLNKVSKLKLPYKIGLVQNGLWQAPAHLAQDPYFKGYVVFLLRTANRP
ncbi:DUF3142 domain-containing protein [Acinetobacter sp. YH01020]|uniref:DUF3142 domain-containing protein n=1 Tax=Acinetobacter sp. YH01020 TaxID=2601034 RepID=UPI0015D3F0A4